MGNCRLLGCIVIPSLEDLGLQFPVLHPLVVVQLVLIDQVQVDVDHLGLIMLQLDKAVGCEVGFVCLGIELVIPTFDIVVGSY